jgi:outer membrane murein-binding lipoprotein Lpp
MLSVRIRGYHLFNKPELDFQQLKAMGWSMKKLIYFAIVMSVLMLVGCGKAKVEDVVKDHVKKKFSSDSNLTVDISKLKYTVTKKEGDTATVNVSGTIHCEGQIFLVKEGGKWKINQKEPARVSPKKKPSTPVEIKETSHAAPEKIASHGEQGISHK